MGCSPWLSWTKMPCHVRAAIMGAKNPVCAYLGCSRARLLHRNAVRACRVLERRVEVELKTRIERQRIVGDLDHMHFMISFEVDFAKIILVEKVIGDHQALVILSEGDVVRASVHPKVDNGLLHEAVRLRPIADI